MGVAGVIFELHPSSFTNQCNFLRCTNGITTTFWYIYWFQSYKKPQTTSSPGYSSLWFFSYVFLMFYKEWNFLEIQGTSTLTHKY